jgi:hypothetical protein
MSRPDDKIFGRIRLAKPGFWADKGFAIKHLISSGKPSHAAGLKQIRAIQREGDRHEQNDKQA